MFNVDATMMLEDELHSELNNDRENMIDINVNSILNSTICLQMMYGFKKNKKKTTRYGKESITKIQKLGIASIKKTKVGDKHERMQSITKSKNVTCIKCIDI